MKFKKIAERIYLFNFKSSCLLSVTIFLLFLISSPFFVPALEPNKAITQYIHEVWQTDDGLPQNSILAIAQTRDGYLWFGTEEGLVRFDGLIFTVFDKGNTEEIKHNCIFELLVNKKGSLWIGTFGGGLIQLKDGKFTTYSTKEGLSNNKVRSIFEDSKGNLWIGTRGGLNRLKDGKFTTYTTKEGLSNDIVKSIYEDSKGSLWIGTDGGGLSRLKDGKFTTYTTKEGLSNDMVRSIFEDSKGSLWIGTTGGLNRLRDGKFTTYTKKEGLSNDNVRSIFEDSKGSLWIGTDGGLNRLRDGKFTTYTTKEGLSNNNVRSIHEDREGNLWIGTYAGLNRLKNGKFTTYSTKEGLSIDNVKSIYEDREGNLWIGTTSGLNRLKNGKFTTYTTKEGLSNNFVTSIYEDKEGSLWIGTYGGGLNRFKNGKFTTYAKKKGFFDDNVYQILEDEKGNLWMSCNKGIFQVNKKELNDFAEGRIHSISSISYGKADGMKSNECNGGMQPAGWKTRDGKLWFPTVKGVAIIDPEKISVNEQPPPVIIEQVIIDKESIDLVERIRLSPGKKKFEFHYTGLSFLVPEKVLFKYKLDGFDKKWVDAGTRRTAYYTNIPPGRYIFKVIACNNDGVWSTSGASFDFYLRPHFYQAWWFYLICVIGVALSGSGIYSLRVRQLKKHKEELEKEVAARTVELKAANTELKDFAHIVSHDLKAPLRAVYQLATWISQDYANAFDKDGQERMNLLTSRVKRMDNLIGGILQYSRVGRLMGKEEEVNIDRVVTEVIDNLAPPDNIKITIENKLPMLQADRVRIEQVFQNLISNAIKYMDKPEGEIKIGCVDEGSFWKFSVADNGPGIEEKYYDKIFQIFQTLEARDQNESTGVGLSVVKKIVELYRGKIWVESKLGQGATFFFTLPKKK